MSGAIKQALVNDAWLGHPELLEEGDLDRIAWLSANTVTQVVRECHDHYLPSPDLDPAWISGWHAAIDHALFAIGGDS